MLYNVMYNSVVLLSYLNAFALGVPTNSKCNSSEYLFEAKVLIASLL